MRGNGPSQLEYTIKLQYLKPFGICMGIVSSMEQDNLDIDTKKYGYIVCDKNAFQISG